MRTSTLDVVLKLTHVPQWEQTLPEALQFFQPGFTQVDLAQSLRFGATHCAPAVRPAALSWAARAGVLFSSIYSDFCSEILSPPRDRCRPGQLLEEGGPALQTIIPQAAASAGQEKGQPAPPWEQWGILASASCFSGPTQAPMICRNLRWGIKIETTYVPTRYR